MALKILPGKLATGARFKLTGTDNVFKCCTAGHAVRYCRSPVFPGMFVVWADYGLRWYLRVNAVDLPNLVEEV